MNWSLCICVTYLASVYLTRKTLLIRFAKNIYKIYSIYLLQTFRQYCFAADVIVCSYKSWLIRNYEKFWVIWTIVFNEKFSFQTFKRYNLHTENWRKYQGVYIKFNTFIFCEILFPPFINVEVIGDQINLQNFGVLISRCEKPRTI